MSGKILLHLIMVLPAFSYAFDDMNESEMSDTVAQDGMSINLVFPVLDGAGVGNPTGFTANQIVWHDTNGLGGANTPGAVVYGAGVPGDRLRVEMPFWSSVAVNIDAADNAGKPLLNVSIETPIMKVITGKTYVGVSHGLHSQVTNLTAAISDGMTYYLGAMKVFLQLGAEPQGHMLVLKSVMTGGLRADGYSLHDLNSGGSITVPSVSFVDTSYGGDLSVKMGVDVTASGLILRVLQLGTVAGGMDARMTGLRFGDAMTPPVGNVEVVGLNLLDTAVRIAGKN